jgi:hypothetical protein
MSTIIAISLAGGSGIFAIFIVVFAVAVVFSLYTRTGSAINQRPYGNVYTNAPGAQGPSVLSHDESAARRLTRGTR